MFAVSLWSHHFIIGVRHITKYLKLNKKQSNSKFQDFIFLLQFSLLHPCHTANAFVPWPKLKRLLYESMHRTNISKSYLNICFECQKFSSKIKHRFINLFSMFICALPWPRTFTYSLATFIVWKHINYHFVYWYAVASAFKYFFII